MDKKSHFFLDVRWMRALFVEGAFIFLCLYFKDPNILFFVLFGLVIMLVYPIFYIMDDQGVRIYNFFGFRKRTYLWKCVTDVWIDIFSKNGRSVVFDCPSEEDPFRKTRGSLPETGKVKIFIEIYTGITPVYYSHRELMEKYYGDRWGNRRKK